MSDVFKLDDSNEESGSDLGALGSTLKSLTKANLPPAQLAQALSVLLLPALQDFMQNGGQAKIAMGAQIAHELMTDFGPQELAIGAIKAQLVTRDQVKSGITKAFAEQTYEKALESSKSTRAYVMGMKAAELTKVSKAINSVLPPKAYAWLDETMGTTTQTAEASTRKTRAQYRNYTDEQLATHAVNKAKAFPVEQLTDMVYETIHGITPQKLNTLVKTFAKAVSADDLESIGLNGAQFAMDAMGALATGGKVSAVIENSSAASAFQTALKKFTSGLEDAVIAADILPSAATQQAFRTAMAEYKKIELPKPAPKA